MKKTAREQVRYAVVGLGHLAQVAVLPAFRHASDSKLVALISDDPKKQTKLARQYGVEKVYRYRDYEECLSDGVDAVYIVLPNHLHREFTVRALDAGAHVLCEKPMAVTAKDCQTMIRAGERNKRKLMIAYRLHFERANLKAIDIGQGGKLGNLRFFSSEFAQQVVKDNVRLTEKVARGGGPVYDMGVYCINAARYLFRSEPAQVFASSGRADRIRFRNTEEMSSVVLKFPEERFATFTVSFGAADVGRYTLAGHERSFDCPILLTSTRREIICRSRLTVRPQRRAFPSGTNSRRRSVIFPIAFLTTENPSLPGVRAWRMYES